MNRINYDKRIRGMNENKYLPNTKDALSGFDYIFA